ncbi:hypothetical protein BGY98DRAFT_988554 [Russula aff. rugulosa BPL654]|nr:hypothetical protein BGY98DRAFT_988554 [Russula aff. rugulosa BPL654]
MQALSAWKLVPVVIFLGMPSTDWLYVDQREAKSSLIIRVDGGEGGIWWGCALSCV